MREKVGPARSRPELLLSSLREAKRGSLGELVDGGVDMPPAAPLQTPIYNIYVIRMFMVEEGQWKQRTDAGCRSMSIRIDSDSQLKTFWCPEQQ